MSCLIQFRLPDGRSIREKFSTSLTLSAVETHLVKADPEILSKGSFSLLTTFPKKEYTSSMFEQTKLGSIAEINPQGTMIVQPVEKKGKMEKGQAVFLGKVLHADTESDFDAIIKKYISQLVVVDYSATWCGPCRNLGPAFEKLATTYKNVVFMKVDVDKNSSVAKRERIRSMPTIHFWKGGKRLEEEVKGYNDRVGTVEIEKIIKKNS